MPDALLPSQNEKPKKQSKNQAAGNQEKEKDEDEKQEEPYVETDPNYYTNYGVPYEDYQDAFFKSFKGKPKHKYTMEIHRAMYNDEMFELYKRYELAVHNKERTKRNIISFLCNSPLFDPVNEPEKMNSPSLYYTKSIDKVYHKFKDEGIYPRSRGTYHIYHRIDGKLVAFSVNDITTRYFDSCYFVYDPDYKFLNLGVVGAIREFEYMRLIKQKYNPRLKYYLLGDMVPNCPKVNYKVTY